MKKLILLIFIGILFYFISCNTKKSLDTSMISTDSATIAKGNKLFDQSCGACHSFKQHGIGPRLSGLTTEISSESIMNFIRAPKAIIESGDERARKLLEKFKTTMPSFDFLSDADINAIIAFLHTQKIAENKVTKSGELTDPIPEPIALSDLVIGLDFLTQMPATAEQKPITRITKLDYQPNTDKIGRASCRERVYSSV